MGGAGASFADPGRVVESGLASNNSGAPRLHRQWLPNKVMAEPGVAPDLIHALEARGHKVTVGRNATSANSIAATPNGFIGVADMRTRGALAAGF